MLRSHRDFFKHIFFALLVENEKQKDQMVSIFESRNSCVKPAGGILRTSQVLFLVGWLQLFEPNTDQEVSQEEASLLFTHISAWMQLSHIK